jgi:hypothetical protein
MQLSLAFGSNLIEDLRKFESICKTVLAHESGDPGVQVNEKTEGRKSRDTVPLNLSWPFLDSVCIMFIGTHRHDTYVIFFKNNFSCHFYNDFGKQ